MDSPEATRTGGNRESRGNGPHQGWYLELPDARGTCDCEQPDRTEQANGSYRHARERFAPTPGSMLRPLCDAAETKRCSM